jgi:hypothetical protein
MHAHFLRRALLMLAAAYTAGCGSSTTATGDLLVVASVLVDPPGATLAAGETRQFKAEPRTSSGVLVPGRPVTWTSSDPEIATVGVTTGLVTAVGSGGPVALTASVDGVSETVPITVATPTIYTLTIITQPSSSAEDGDKFGTQPVVRVQNLAGTNVGGVAVTASLASGPPGATLGGTLTITSGSKGRATFTNLFIKGPEGTYTLRFSAALAEPVTSRSIELEDD